MTLSQAASEVLPAFLTRIHISCTLCLFHVNYLSPYLNPYKPEHTIALSIKLNTGVQVPEVHSIA